MLKDEVLSYFVAGAGGFWITSHEEHRILPELRAVARSKRIPFFLWSAVKGLSTEKGETPCGEELSLDTALTYLAGMAMREDRFFAVLCDPHESLSPGTKRRMRELVEDSKGRHLVIVVCPSNKVPLELERCFFQLKFSLPSEAQLVEKLEELEGLESKAQRSLAEAAVGFTLLEASVAVKRALTSFPKDIEAAAQMVWDAKTIRFENTGLVVVQRPMDRWEDVGGCYTMKAWLEKRLGLFADVSRVKHKGLLPKGMLLTGLPGTGKSLVSRAVANYLHWKYVEWTLSRIYSPYVGSTEQNLERLLEITWLHAPCVVRIDEVSHQMSGHESSGITDPGVQSRVTGRLLTVMEEGPPGVYWVMNTNEPWRLPPHFVRRGRLDKIWALPLPRTDALSEILKIHIRKYAPEIVLTEEQEQETVNLMFERKFAGAEVEQTVVEAVQGSYPATPTARQLHRTVLEVTAAATIMQEQVQRLEKWISEGRAHLAD